MTKLDKTLTCLTSQLNLQNHSSHF